VVDGGTIMSELLSNPVELIQLGFAGFGFALAVLAAGMIKVEQKSKSDARPAMTRLIYTFMAFALLLAGGGLASEYFKEKTASSEHIAVNEERQKYQNCVEQKATEFTQLVADIANLRFAIDTSLAKYNLGQTSTRFFREVMSQNQGMSEKLSLINEGLDLYRKAVWACGQSV